MKENSKNRPLGTRREENAQRGKKIYGAKYPMQAFCPTCRKMAVDSLIIKLLQLAIESFSINLQNLRSHGLVSLCRLEDLGNITPAHLIK